MSGSRPAYRGRIAPSPTGLLHLGHACTFRVAEQRAHESAGRLILRNDDLDPQRSRAEYVTAVIEDLEWLGIEWQEGPDVGGDFAPYSQSERLSVYLAAWRRLAAAGSLYPCVCTRRELAEMANAPHEPAPQQPDGFEHDEPIYFGRCRPAGDLPASIPDSPDGVTWRFRVPDGEVIRFVDGYYGEQTFTAGVDFGDFPVWRRDGVPAYQLACVVDDAAMQITEVVRGADLLKSTARQLLLYRALGLMPPEWFHCPLVEDTSGRRLAKRTDAVSLRTLRELGRTPQAVLAMLEAR